MKERCLNPNASNYRWYGGKGVSISETWNEFVPFMEWAMTHGYKDGLEIDRLDSNGDYEPDNCEWVTKAENLRRMRVGLNGDLTRRLDRYAQDHGKSTDEVMAIALERLLVEEVNS